MVNLWPNRDEGGSELCTEEFHFLLAAVTGLSNVARDYH